MEVRADHVQPKIPEKGKDDEYFGFTLDAHEIRVRKSLSDWKWFAKYLNSH